MAMWVTRMQCCRARCPRVRTCSTDSCRDQEEHAQGQRTRRRCRSLTVRSMTPTTTRYPHQAWHHNVTNQARRRAAARTWIMELVEGFHSIYPFRHRRHDEEDHFELARRRHDVSHLLNQHGCSQYNRRRTQLRNQLQARLHHTNIHNHETAP